MKIQKIIHHLIFGLIISAIFGLLAFMILLLPVFFHKSSLETILRISVFTIFEIGLFIGGINFSINYEKEQLIKSEQI